MDHRDYLMREQIASCVKCFHCHVKHDLSMLVSGFSSGIVVIVSVLWSLNFIVYICVY